MGTVPSSDPGGSWSVRRELPRRASLPVMFLFVLAVLNGLDGISAITRSRMFVWSAPLAFGTLWAWGWALLVLAVGQLVGVLALLLHLRWARWPVMALVVIDIVAQMVVMPAYPLWSLVVIAVNLLTLYALWAFPDRPTERLVRTRERPQLPVESRNVPFPQ